MSPEEIDRVVARIDTTRRTTYFRDPDRPDPSTFKARRGRVPPEVVRAQGRLRSAHWRTRMDRDKRPTSTQIGLALVRALVTANLHELTSIDSDLVGRALVDLQSRGFSIVEAKRTLRKIREREVDPADRAGEPGDGCSAPIRLAGEEENDLPF